MRHSVDAGNGLTIQITDRYSLVSNLSEAVERDVHRLQVEPILYLMVRGVVEIVRHTCLPLS